MLIKEALEETVDEMLSSMTKESISNIMELINILRNEMVLPQLNLSLIENNIWGKIRKNRNLITDVLSLTAIFQINLGETGTNTAIEEIATSLCMFKNHDGFKTIADKEFTESFGTEGEVLDIISSDRWLFFLTALTLHSRILTKRLLEREKVPN